MEESNFIDDMGEMDDIDLFIEAPQAMQAMQTMHPATPAPKGLLARVEELCISGACQ